MLDDADDGVFALRHGKVGDAGEGEEREEGDHAKCHHKCSLCTCMCMH